MDLKKFDKNGNPLNLTPQSDPNKQGNYHAKWLNNPNRYEPTPEDIKCELQLQALGDFEPLSFHLDDVEYGEFKKEIEPWNDKWVPYLRREGITNDREGLCLVGYEGDSPSDSLSMPEARRRVGRRLEETDFNYKTELYYDLKSLHPLLEKFDTLGRTMLVKCNAGGWFPPHRDAPYLTRDTFRIVVFLGKCVSGESFEWEMNGRKQYIEPNRAYYIDTRKTHRTHSWRNDSIHCVINVPKTWENVIKLMSMTLHY